MTLLKKLSLICGISVVALLSVSYGAFQPQRDAVQETQFSHQPGQLVGEDQAAHKQQQDSAAQFDRVQITAKLLIKLQELNDAERRKQKRDCKSGGIKGQQQNTSPDRCAIRGQCQYRCQDWSNAGRPAKCKRKAQEESAENAGLLAGIAQVDVAIQPTGQCGTEKSDDRE